MEFTEEMKDLIRYGDIISDDHFITDNGAHRVLVIKYCECFHLVHMHNGDIVKHIELK